MHLKRVSPAWIVGLVTLLLFVSVFPFFNVKVSGQTTASYWVTVNPTTDSVMYTTVGHNWTLAFQAVWSYGNNSGQPISNATVTMQVSGSKGEAINTLNLNTTSGIFSFSYSSSTADILTFTPIKLTTQDGVRWNSNLLKISGNSAYGFQSNVVTVWWDTFHVSLTNSNTKSLEAATVSVNVTYLLLPQGGLTLPSVDTYSNQTFLPKIAEGANVTINGVSAQETSVGIYEANVSTVFPTAYVIVMVSQKGWTTTSTAFSFSHNANEAVWMDASIIGLILMASSLALYFVLVKKPTQPTSLFGSARFPFIGGVLLLAASVVSLFWGSIGVEGTLHGFSWLLLAVSGLGSFGLGLAGSWLSIMKKNQALVIAIIVELMVVNLLAVKSSLDAYQLSVPWLTIFVSLAATILCGCLISNSDEQFSKTTIDM
ncbi:MAG: hypothetical protein ABSA75_07280 [Candidatus Bathyarchaeia archaeon]|jgi:hypothetical protein